VGGRSALSSTVTNAQVFSEPILFQVKPNPANDKAIVSYDIDPTANGELRICNSVGQEILKTNLDPRKKKYTINADEMTNGIYYLSLNVNGKLIKTLKLIVMH
jgi:hypothetical protein